LFGGSRVFKLKVTLTREKAVSEAFTSKTLFHIVKTIENCVFFNNNVTTPFNFLICTTIDDEKKKRHHVSSYASIVIIIDNS
jgi:hypothetical protein